MEKKTKNKVNGNNPIKYNIKIKGNKPSVTSMNIKTILNRLDEVLKILCNYK